MRVHAGTYRCRHRSSLHTTATAAACVTPLWRGHCCTADGHGGCAVRAVWCWPDSHRHVCFSWHTHTRWGHRHGNTLSTNPAANTTHQKNLLFVDCTPSSWSGIRVQRLPVVEVVDEWKSLQAPMVELFIDMTESKQFKQTHEALLSFF